MNGHLAKPVRREALEATMADAIGLAYRVSPTTAAAELRDLVGAEQMDQLWALLADTLRQAAAELHNHPEADDYAEIAHRLKGAAGTMGLERLYHAADAADSPTARQALTVALDQALAECAARQLSLCAADGPR